MENNTTPSSAASGKAPTSFNCVRCFERKVKCNKQQPCSNCVRQGTDCQYRIPAPPKRRRRRVQDEVLNDRLKKYEQALQEQGIDPNDIAPKSEPVTLVTHGESYPTRSGIFPAGESDRQYVSSQIIYDQGRARYVENSLWNRVHEEIESPNDAIDGTSESEPEDDTPNDVNADYMLAWTPNSTAPRPYHPPPDQMSRLWQLFLENFNPLSKVIHRPTLQPMIEKAIINIDKMPRGLEALMFAIYTGAILTLTEKQCEDEFGERKRILLPQYQAATKMALSRAKFLGTSDIVVLQALTIHLLTMREFYDARTLWVLVGVAVRIAEGMGLHRDGAKLGLPIFESEIRRRIWWQIAMLDYRSAELSGSAKFRSMFGDQYGCDMPMNVDDNELYPGMNSKPLPRACATEMVFCSLRYHFGHFWNRKQKARAAKGEHEEHLWGNYTSVEAIAAKDKDIDELQELLQNTYVRFCDPVEPVQLMASLLASGAVSTMRLVAHHPRRYAKEEDMPEEERQLVWKLSLKLLEGYNMPYTDRKLSRFIWHVSYHFQWQALIHVLDCLRAQPLMLEAPKAWKIVHEVYENRPELANDTKKPIHVACGTLCLKAYAAWEQAVAIQGSTMPYNAPEYIVKLRRQREAAHAKHAEAVAARLQAQDFSSTASTRSETTPGDTQQLHPQGQDVYQTQHANAHTLQSQHDIYNNSSAVKMMTSMDTSNPNFIINSHGFSLGQNNNNNHMHQQDPNNSWFGDFGYQGFEHDIGMNLDPDFMLTQDGNAMDATTNMIDWTQWDTLLQNSEAMGS